MKKKHPCVTGRVRSLDAVKKDRRLWGRSVLLDVFEGTAADPKRVRVLMVEKGRGPLNEWNLLRRRQDPCSFAVYYIEDPRHPTETLLAAS